MDNKLRQTHFGILFKMHNRIKLQLNEMHLLQIFVVKHFIWKHVQVFRTQLRPFRKKEWAHALSYTGEFHTRCLTASLRIQPPFRTPAARRVRAGDTGSRTNFRHQYGISADKAQTSLPPERCERTERGEAAVFAGYA